MQLRVIGPVANILLRLHPIPYQRFDAPAVGRRKRLSVSGGNLVPAERVEVFVDEPRRLADAVDVHEAKAAVEWGGRRSGFVEDVAIGPVAHPLEKASGALELGQDPRRGDVAVVDGIARRVAGAPFGEIER